MYEGKDFSGLTGKEAHMLSSILDRFQMLQGDAVGLLESLGPGDYPAARTENLRSLNALSAIVNRHLGGCYGSLASGRLSTLEIELWLPFLESVRNDLRRIGFAITGSTCGLGVAVARFRATLTRSPTGRSRLD